MKFSTVWFGTCLLTAATLVMLALERAEEENNEIKVQVMSLIGDVWFPSTGVNCTMTRVYCISEYTRLSEAIAHNSESYTPYQLLTQLKAMDLQGKKRRFISNGDVLTRELARLEDVYGLERTRGSTFEVLAKNRDFAAASGVWRGYFLSSTAEESFAAVMTALPRVALVRAFHETCKSPVFLRVSSKSRRVAEECKKSLNLPLNSLAELRAHLWRAASDLSPTDSMTLVQNTVAKIPREFFLTGYRRQPPMVDLVNFLQAMRVPVHANDTQNPVALVETFSAYGMEKLRADEAAKVWKTANWRLSWTKSSNALLTPVKLFAGVAESVRFWPRYFEATSSVQIELAYNEFKTAAADLMDKYMPLNDVCYKMYNPVVGLLQRFSRVFYTRDITDAVFNDNWGEIFRLYRVCETLPAALAELPSRHVLIDQLFNTTERASIDEAGNNPLHVYNRIFLKGQLPTDNQECSICYEANSNHQTACGHYYHRACLDRWTQTHSSCPMCRQGI